MGTRGGGGMGTRGGGGMGTRGGGGMGTRDTVLQLRCLTDH